MPGTQLTCPHCLSTLNFGDVVQAGTTLPCLICNRTFTVRGAAVASPPGATIATGKSGARLSSAGAAAPPRVAVARHASQPAAAVAKTAPAQTSRRTVPAAPDGAKSPGSGRLLGGVLLIGVALLMLSGLTYFVWNNVLADRVAKDGKEPPPVVLAKGPGAEKEPGNGSPPVVDTTEPKQPDPKAEPEKKKDAKPPSDGGEEDVANLPKKGKLEKPPVLTAPKIKAPDDEKPITPPPTVEIVVPAPVMATSVDAKRVDAAIAGGIRYLKGRQGADGSWQKGYLNQIGYTSLSGLALLECKVPADDPAVRKAAEYVRANVGHPANARTYDLATGLLFLERLGDARDRELIRNLSLFLTAAQNPAGGWAYKAYVAHPTKTPDELQGYLRTHWPWSAAHPKPMAGAKKADDAPLPTVDLLKLPVNKLVWNQTNPYMLMPGDNSNTQFALLALWAARRHDIATECPILLSYQRFLTTQTADGGWVYRGAVTLPGFPATPALPAGGLPGFVGEPGFNPGGSGLPAIPGGPQPGPPPGAGPAIALPNTQASPTMTCVGLMGLAMGYGVLPSGGKGGDKDRLDNPAIKKGLDTLARYVGTPSAGPGTENHYLLWSIERVAVLYDLKTIGGKDWYGWGAQILLASQQSSGGWVAGGADVSDTSFALLFLKRANLMADLTEHLRLNMVIRDPGTK